MELSSMANAWVDSYLEALLTTGLSAEYSRKASEQTRGQNSDEPVETSSIAAKYYINQILTMDEASIQQAWMKVSHKGRLAGDKDARLEQLSWRVWGMKRKKAMLADQNAQALAELSKSAGAATDEDQQSAVDEEELAKLYTPSLKLMVPASRSDSSEELGVLSPDLPSSPGVPTQVESALGEGRVPKLYCVLISMHGLVRGQRMELGKDPDTGGQVKYVVEYAKALARHPAVHRVDLLTRLIRDPQVDPEYGQAEEALEEPEGQLGGAYIVRIPCGPQNVYLKKEHLWPYVREFSDNAIEHVTSTMGKLMAMGEPCELYDIHGHYADAGEAAALISFTLGADMVLTGHSLGRNKLEHLLKGGSMSRREIEATYAISRRIEGEERALDAAAIVFTSTQQEVKDQWGLYDGYDPALERVVRQRYRKGRHFPVMHVIPPGLDFSALKVELPHDPFETLYTHDSNKELVASLASVYGSRMSVSGRSNTSTEHLDQLADLSQPGTPHGGMSQSSPRGPIVRPDPPIWQEIFRFLGNPRKPVILAMSRPDAKKNITTLVKAYGSHQGLRDIANLVLIMGNREVIDSMAGGSQQVLMSVMKLIDQYDLYGNVAYPKHHSQSDISDIYMLPAATRGVFVNIALQEPFGLTLIEAAAHGVPIVATTNGGPVDIINTLHNGMLVEPTDVRAVQESLLQLLMQPSVWDECSQSGLANIMAYSWPSHCRKALICIESEKQGLAKRRKNIIRSTFSSSLDDFQLLGSAAPATPGRDDSGTPRPGAGRDEEAVEGDLGILREPHLSFVSEALDAASLRDDDAVRTPPMSAKDSSPHNRSPRRSLASTSVPLDAAYGGSEAYPELNGSAGASPRSKTPFQGHASPHNARLRRVRDKYVVFLVDGADTIRRLAGLLAKKGKALLGLTGSGQRVGLGIASTQGLQETQELMARAGLGLADLDFCITNAGAEIWYCNAEGDTELDETYEAVLEDKWDKVSVRRVLAQILAQRSVLLGPAAAKLPPGGGGRGIRPRLRVHTDTTPHHLLFELGAPEAGDTSESAQAVNALIQSPTEQLAMLDRIRRRFRRSGLRTQMTAHLDASGAVKLHITPLRASRALALRHMAHRHKVDLANLVLVCCATGLEADGQVAQFATSDMEDVVAGVQGVLLVPPSLGAARDDAPAGAAEAMQAAASPAPGAQGYAVPVGLYTHDGRLQVLAGSLK